MLDRGVERRLAAGDGLDRGADLLGARVLGQVAAGAGAQGAEHGGVVGVGGQRDRGVPRAASRLIASMPSMRGIRRSISTTSGLVLGGERDRLLAVGGGADELDPVEQPEQRAEALADDALVVGQQDPYAGSHSSTRKPSSVGPAFRRPPSSSARSRMPVSP